jgi:hypothetical protein
MNIDNKEFVEFLESMESLNHNTCPELEDVVAFYATKHAQNVRTFEEFILEEYVRRVLWHRQQNGSYVGPDCKLLACN